MTNEKLDEIPIEAAKNISKKYNFDQIVIIGRRVGSHEAVTTYCKNKEHCDVAARIGNYLKFKIMNWV
jgi:hypothetical protein